MDISLEFNPLDEGAFEAAEKQRQELLEQDRKLWQQETSHYAQLLESVEQEAGPIDRDEAERMLKALDITKVITCAYGSTNLFTPRRQGDSYDWEKVPETVDWAAVERDLKRLGTKNLGFISCPGGTRVKDRLGPAEIFECSLLVYEIDGLPKDQQWKLWEKAGLPEPTLVMDTGNNSLHVWKRLSKPVTPEQGRIARKRLSLAIEAVLPEGVTTDSAMHSVHQPARLAGGIHPKTGERSTIVLETGNVFELDELMALCPELPESVATDRTGTIWRDDEEMDPDSIDLPELPLAKPVPLTIALGEKSLQDIRQGVSQGGRRLRAWSLSQTLQCAEEQLKELGQPFTGSAFELWQQFVEKCDLDLESTVDGYWVEDDQIGEGDLSRAGLLVRLRKFAIDDCGWDPDDWWKNPAPGGFLAKARAFRLKHIDKLRALCSVGNKKRRELAQTEEDKQAAKESNAVSAIQERMENLYELERSGRRDKNIWAQKQYHRSVLGGYRIRSEEVDRRLIEMVAAEWDLSIHSETGNGQRGRSMLQGPGEHDLMIPQIPGFTLLGRDALAVGSGGVGKTMAGLALSYQTATGATGIFDRDDPVDPGAQGATLWIGTDGGDGAYGMLNKYINVLNAPQERTFRSKLNFWGANAATGERPWAFTVSDLHKLFQELEQGFNGVPYRLVVIDSLKAVMDLAGIDFGIGPMGSCMRLIQSAAAKFNVTVLWLHHTKPGAAKGDMGIDGAGGNSNITQVPFAVHTLHKVHRKGHGDVVRWNVAKLRGESSRTFEYGLDTERGMFKQIFGDVEEDRSGEILEQLFLQRSGGVSTTELDNALEAAKRTISKTLTALGKEGKVKSLKKRWFITPSGMEGLLELMPELKSQIEEALAEGG